MHAIRECGDRRVRMRRKPSVNVEGWKPGARERETFSPHPVYSPGGQRGRQGHDARRKDHRRS